MENYADAEGRFIGASNCGVKPDGVKHETDKAPKSSSDVYDAKKDAWVPAADSSQPESILCQGLTKSGTMCKHKATHGGYCRQHIGQQA